MTVDFSPANYRAASSDLAISISPLGLVELADEEFEIHGPRLNRYSLNWAMYLGSHYSYRRATGEPQVVINLYRALTDYVINFTFGKGVQFRSPKVTEAIVPDLLKRIWETDNDKATLLWEIGQQGAVSGDVFLKVAYEEARTDAAGGLHPGKVRILPLNAAYCFPEFHPHDRDRLIRFKLKYRFWGTSPEGTRQVYTYTEILTDDQIEEYINDELIDSRPNPLGEIPVVHIPNFRVSGSPWGLADGHDIVNINRQYNEVATAVSDIVNYHAEPTTVIIGAKASQLEKGANKIWGGLPDKAQVFNLEGGAQGLNGALELLNQLKQRMHELTGVPESALGQMQPISNTSGVALSIMFQPLMNKWQQKVALYSRGLERVNELALKQLFLKEPEMVSWQENDQVPLREDQLAVLDLADPISCRSMCYFPQPLPLDKLVVLNELSMKVSMGLESKEGALRALGEEFPDEKLAEIRSELIEDAKADGAIEMLKSMIASATSQITGIGPDGMPLDPSVASAPGDGQAPQQGLSAEQVQAVAPTPFEMAGAEGVQKMAQELLVRSFGTKLAQSQVAHSGQGLNTND